ncbi:MAG: fructosamine kinase family protein [Spirochaetia bacterium]|nr:fructosamine kinase family protein [Spirochaetia bacterium]
MKNPFEKFTGQIYKKNRLAGGDINEVYHLICLNGEFLLKNNNGGFTKMFENECFGLNHLRENNLPVPKVISFNEDAILLEYFNAGKPCYKEAGTLLAKLHQKTSENFGFFQNNYIGSLNQINNFEKDWILFYQKHRLQYQLNLWNLSHKLTNNELNIWSKLFEKLPVLLTHKPKPSLLHGDLWSGNLYFSDKGPIFIDPAVYYGDALIELAFTELFGAFDSAFYSAYQEIHSICEIYKDIKKLYQIYPLLVHANLFGINYYHTALNSAKYYAS